MIESLTECFGQAQEWLFESTVQPLMFHLGMANLLEDGFAATGWLLVGLLQIAVLVAVIGPLERWRPVEPVTDRRAIRVDILYTLIHRLGLFRLAMFFTVTAMLDAVFGRLRVAGLPTIHLDELWPGVTDQALVAFIIYLVVFDFVDYWIHRGQHQINAWWSLHAVHHSQRQMTMWSDNRNHLLDDVVREFIIATVAWCVGVPPGQFVAVVAITQLSENFQHANLRLGFGRWGERLWISPRFHRVHHSVGIGHESADGAGRVRLGGHNFGVLLPWWDLLFGTANFDLDRYEPTGIRDQVEAGRDYGRGFWAQQWLGLRRLFGRG